MEGVEKGLIFEQSNSTCSVCLQPLMQTDVCLTALLPSLAVLPSMYQLKLYGKFCSAPVEYLAVKFIGLLISNIFFNFLNHFQADLGFQTTEGKKGRKRVELHFPGMAGVYLSCQTCYTLGNVTILLYVEQD